jgi:hypothetical protein
MEFLVLTKNPVMKTLLLIALLAALVYYRCHSSTPVSTAASDTIAHTREIIVAPAPSYHDRWKTGPNAQTDLKTGPNAQVTFEPFLPNEQANWNPNPGYTIVSGWIRR